jgi:hypothetical protein
MKYAAIVLGAMMFLAPPSVVQPGASLAASTLPINFNILPGAQHPGRPVVRSFDYVFDHGAVHADSLMIVNPSKTSPLTVRLSVSDAITRPQGGGIEFNDSTHQQYIGHWILLGASIVTVPPYHLSYVPITVRVPANARAGQYEGAINAIDVNAQTVTSGNFAARVYLNRRCIVLLRITGTASTGLRVEHATFTAGGAHGLLRLVLHNTGSTLVYPTLISIELHGHGSTTLHAAAGTVTAGDSTLLAYPLPKSLPAGLYGVRITVHYVSTVSNKTSRTLQATWTGRTVVTPT